MEDATLNELSGSIAALLHKSADGAAPFSRTDSSHGLCDRDAKRGVTVQNGGTDLKLGDLSVEAPCHEALPQPFHTVDLRFVQRAGNDGLPRFGVLAGRE